MHDEQSNTIPSEGAVSRLRFELHRRTASYEAELDIDLEDIDRAMQSGRHCLAADMVREHIQRLEQFQDELRQMLAAAAVEREAEGVLDVLVGNGGPVSGSAVAQPDVLDAPQGTPGGTGRRTVPGRAALTGSLLRTSLVAVALVLLGLPLEQQDPLTDAQTASEQVLVAAASAAADGSAVDGAAADGPEGTLAQDLRELASDLKIPLGPLAAAPGEGRSPIVDATGNPVPSGAAQQVLPDEEVRPAAEQPDQRPAVQSEVGAEPRPSAQPSGPQPEDPSSADPSTEQDDDRQQVPDIF